MHSYSILLIFKIDETLTDTTTHNIYGPLVIWAMKVQFQELIRRNTESNRGSTSPPSKQVSNFQQASKVQRKFFFVTFFCC